ncbi:MAG: type II toxin-antitoxin system MqsA family antitoxin [Desulfuromonadales bacterium]|nr:type II toxin-antitoxin system MqsA family antitoxin [Desulfuromonadales bacterium]
MVCTNCFDTDLVTIKKSYLVHISGVEKIINDVEREECPICGYSIFTQAQAIALDKKRVELEFGTKPLLTPYQLKLLRNVLDMTLDQVSEILHIGKNSYGRWERGESEITPSMNLLIHNLIDRMPVAKVNLIESERNKKIFDSKKRIFSQDENISLGKYVKDCIDGTGILPLIICDQIDIKEDCLRKIENNKVDITTVGPEAVYRLAKFFKITYDELVKMISKSLEIYRIGGEVNFIHARVVDNKKFLTKDEENSIGDILEAIGEAFPDEQPSSDIDRVFLSKIKQYFDSEAKGA